MSQSQSKTNNLKNVAIAVANIGLMGGAIYLAYKAGKNYGGPIVATGVGIYIVSSYSKAYNSEQVVGG